MTLDGHRKSFSPIFCIPEIFTYFCGTDKRTLAMSKLEHTHPLMNKLTNIYKSGG